VYIAGNRVTLKLTADGVPVPGLDGVAVNDQDHFTATAANQFCLRTNKDGAVSVTLDGNPFGLLPGAGNPGSWIFAPGASPQPAPSPC